MIYEAELQDFFSPPRTAASVINPVKSVHGSLRIQPITVSNRLQKQSDQVTFAPGI